MTGNELAISVKPNPPLNPSEWIGEWLRGKGTENVELKKKVEALEQQLIELNDKRRKQVAVMLELAGLLNLKFPDPKKIVDEVKRITSL